MRHYVPIPTDTGFAVAYRNHNHEYRPVMECRTFDAAYTECARLTAEATAAVVRTAEALAAGPRDRYPAIFQG